ncbi:uncharacterized protein [Triticum aestivum]|uniref:uncharacterized protein n=1 Tax=Triticum aestivum TaxID=4565 RepID=UPI001D02FC02|nr:uncharacterized protein LOC123113133 [Triticum aestivum]
MGISLCAKWIPCRSEEPGALRWTMHELAMGGFSSQIVAPAVLMMDVRDVIARHKPSVSMEDLSSTEGSMRSLASRAGHEDTQREYSIGTEEILHEYGWLLFLGRSRIRASKLERKLNKMMRKLLLQLLKIQIMFCVTKLNAKGLILVLALQRKQGGSFSMP